MPQTTTRLIRPKRTVGPRRLQTLRSDGYTVKHPDIGHISFDISHFPFGRNV